MTASGDPKILIYYFAFPHYRRSILESLSRQPGVDIEFISGSSSRGAVDPLNNSDLPMIETHPTVTFGPLTIDIGILSRCMQRQYDIVIVAPAFSSLTTWALLIMRRLFRRQTYLWGDCGHHQGKLRRLLQEAMNRLCTGLLVYGNSSLRGATALGTPPSKVSIVHNAVESNALCSSAQQSKLAFAAIRAKAQRAAQTGEIELLFSGRLTAEKQVDVLLDALSIIQENFVRVRCHILGSGPMAPTLARHKNHDLVQFHGAVYDSQKKAEIFRQATLVVSPISMGLLAVDALRAGLPVLLPDNPNNGSEVEALEVGINALKFSPGDPRALAAAVSRWVEIAQLLDEQAYVEARTSALRVWDPAHVADSIVRSVGRGSGS